MTIREANTLYAEGIWQKTDSAKLTRRLLDISGKNGYELCFLASENPPTTWHPKGSPVTLSGARERYKAEGEMSIDPGLIEVVKLVGRHNYWCNYGSDIDSGSSYVGTVFGDGEWYGRGDKKKMNRIEMSDFMNFLWFGEKVIDAAGSHARNYVKKGFCGIGRKEFKDVADPNPIVVVTNPNRDGIMDIFGKKLRDKASKNGRGIRVVQYGSNDVSSLENYDVDDFDYVNVKFENPAGEYSGIFTKDLSVKCRFTGVKDLLGVENKIDGRFSRGHSSELEYDSARRVFEKARDSDA